MYQVVSGLLTDSRFGRCCCPATVSSWPLRQYSSDELLLDTCLQACSMMHDIELAGQIANSIGPLRSR